MGYGKAKLLGNPALPVLRMTVRPQTDEQSALLTAVTEGREITADSTDAYWLLSHQPEGFALRWCQADGPYIPNGFHPNSTYRMWLVIAAT